MQIESSHTRNKSFTHLGRSSRVCIQEFEWEIETLCGVGLRLTCRFPQSVSAEVTDKKLRSVWHVLPSGLSLYRSFDIALPESCWIRGKVMPVAYMCNNSHLSCLLWPSSVFMGSKGTNILAGESVTGRIKFKLLLSVWTWCYRFLTSHYGRETIISRHKQIHLIWNESNGYL